jgi:hypothetical protein
MIAESLTPKAGIREQNRSEADMRRCRDRIVSGADDPEPDIGRIEIPQRSSLLPY